MKRIYLYSLAMWFVLVVLAILNGIFRESVISPKTNEQIGHLLSSLIFILVIFLMTYLFLKLQKTTHSPSVMLWIGALWLSLTIVFEFVFGHFIIRHPWSKLLADYNLLQGRVWLFVLLATFLAPYICKKYLLK